MLKKLFSSSGFLFSLLTLAFLAAMVADFYPLRSMEYTIYDRMSRIRHRVAATPVVVVAIDEKSIRNIGGWPWPRSYIADMVRQLSKFGAHTLGIYLLYPVKELNSGLQEIQYIRKILRENPQKSKRKIIKKIDGILANAQKRLNHDHHLISAVKSARNVVLPLRFDLDPSTTDNAADISLWLRKNSVVFKNEEARPKLLSMGSINSVGIANNKILLAGQIIQPFSELSRKAGALGHVNLIADHDGVIRKLPLAINYQGREFISFALQVARKYMGIHLKDVKPVSGGLSLNHLKIPTDPYYRMFIDYSGGGANIRKFSFSDVLDGKVPAESFRNKIVMIGVTAKGKIPTYKTAVDSETSAIEISANAVENMINRKHVSRPLWAFALEILALLYFGFFLLFVIPKLKPKVGVLIVGVLLVTWIAASGSIFMAYGIWLKMMAPILLVISGFGLAMRKRLSSENLDENIELNKSLGLALQGQGMLDMAFEKLLKCPIEEKSIKDLLYNLGLDFERKRMFNKALTVYNRILKAGAFKDVKEKIKRVQNIENTLAISTGSAQDKPLLLIQEGTIRPTLGRYEIIKELGKGAMGTVYLGRDPSIHREVAIKTLNYGEVEPDKLEEVRSRFFREAEAAGKLSHTNIVTIFDVGEDHDMAYMAMELLKGKDLTNYCKKGKLLPVKRVLPIISSVAQALDYAHSQGVVHRDIKPANILLLENDQVKLADFGIARVMSSTKTQTGVIFGTPNYMSPEQITGKKVDGRSDLFSLGVVFYELLTGTKPFKEDSITALVYAISDSDYPPLNKVAPKTPPCCVKIVNSLLIKSVSKRCKSAAQVVKQISLCREQGN